VEAPYHWYWLVDGRRARGYVVHVAHTAAIHPYAGLQYPDDHSDARWLAPLLRLGVLPAGSMYPQEGRAVRALWRQRSQLVQHKTTHVLSLQTLFTRHPGRARSGNRLQPRTAEDIAGLLPAPELALAVQSTLAVMRCLATHMATMAQTVPQRVKWQAEFKDLLTGSGRGHILALTMRLETGDIRRFPTVGNFASSCRGGGSQKRSNGNRQGTGHTTNGHKSLAWAFVEAAHCAVRYHPCIKRCYPRQPAQTHTVVATKTVAHPLARACFSILRDQGPFDVRKALQEGRRTGWAGAVSPSMGLVQNHETCLGRCPSLDTWPARSSVWAAMPLA
jgi:transposase